MAQARQLPDPLPPPSHLQTFPLSHLPTVALTDYQRAWIADRSRFKIGLMARQTGKSFAAALEAVLDAARTGSQWVFLSAGERQSRELMAKAHLHARALRATSEAGGPQAGKGEWIRKQLELRLPGGGRIVGLPANPDTARGFSANVLLDEFAFHRDSDAIWSALYPTITRGYCVRIISTPQGKQNRFYRLWQEAIADGPAENAGNDWSPHLVTIEDAARQGFPVDLDQLRAGIGDETAWQQEYLCRFLDEATALMTFELISGCESDEVDKSFNASRPVSGLLYAGVDIGRKHDLTVIWLWERVGDVLWTRGVWELDRAPFDVQADQLAEVLSLAGMGRCCIDASGIGMQLAEQAAQKFGRHLVEEIQFTAPVKEQLATRVRVAAERRTIRIPVDPAIRRDWHAIRKETTAAGHTRYAADRGPSGHADRFWAAALGIHAASRPGGVGLSV